MENIALAEPGAQLSIWALFLQAGWVVKLVMIGLLCASIWTWAIIVDKLVAYARMRLALNRFEQVFWSGQSLEELYRTLADRKTTGMGAIFVAAMREWKKSFEKGAKSPLGAADPHRQGDGPGADARDGTAGGPPRLPRDHRLGRAVHRPVRHRRRHHDLVPGDRRVEESTNLAVVAPGIAEALLATAIGLLAAIPAVIAYNKLSSDAGKIAVRMEGLRRRVLRHTLAPNR